jgi:hypothetical protein
MGKLLGKCDGDGRIIFKQISGKMDVSYVETWIAQWYSAGLRTG